LHGGSASIEIDIMRFLTILPPLTGDP